jgi:hypothetical protein
MGDAMTITELITRLRSRTVPNWVKNEHNHLTHMNGHKPDPDCQMAADELDAARVVGVRQEQIIMNQEAELARNRADHASIVGAYEAELERLRADAERYRYLRDRSPNEVLTLIGTHAGCWIDCESDSGTLTLLTGEDADAAIDAAIAAGDRT